MFELIRKEFGDLGILMNNAGVLQRTTAETIPDQQFDRALDINLKGPFLCTKEAANVMIERGRGRIINVTSVGRIKSSP